MTVLRCPYCYADIDNDFSISGRVRIEITCKDCNKPLLLIHKFVPEIVKPADEENFKKQLLLESLKQIKEYNKNNS
jgi:hypothetical protein